MTDIDVLLPKSTEKYLTKIVYIKIKELKELAERISILTYQIENFKSMADRYKNEVISDLNKDLDKHGFNTRIGMVE